MHGLHEILLQLRNDLGYKTISFSPQNKIDDGLCALYAKKGIDSFLVGEFESVFKPRDEYIYKHHQAFPGLFKKAKEQVMATRDHSVEETPSLNDDELKTIFDVAAFMDQGDLYQNPLNYPALFGKSLSQMDTQAISVFAQSEALKKRGGRALLASFCGVYDAKGLIQYLKGLNQWAESSLHDFAFSLISKDHRIARARSSKICTVIKTTQSYVLMF